MKEPLLFTAGQESEGERLDIFIAEKTGLSRTLVQRCIRAGAVRVDDVVLKKSSCKLKAGSKISWVEPVPEIIELVPEDIPLDIIYEDSDLIVIDKPAGMVVHPAYGNNSGTLANALLFHCNDLTGIGGAIRPGIVHRIDKDTSGLIVAAKNEIAHRELAGQFAVHSIERSYRAFVYGLLKDDEGLISGNIGRHQQDRKKFAVVEEGKGKEAVTHYGLVGAYNELSFVELRLETGRTHQIRVHMAHLGHPVVGDPIYCHPRRASHIKEKKLKDRLLGVKRQLLHAATLGFIHPRTKKSKTFTSPLPDDMQKLLDWLDLQAREN